MVVRPREFCFIDDPVDTVRTTPPCCGRLGGPYACWLRDLRDGWCGLPKLPPAAMKELVVAWSSPGMSGGVVCQSCGVEYPHQNYRPVLAACPGCASREWDWAHLVGDCDRAWKVLDGYVGTRIVGGVT
jgi:hypothetical protein